MAENVMDYQTMLADMEAKKAILEQAIASVRAAIAAGLGVSGDVQIQPGTGSMIMNAGVGLGSSGDIPKGAFRGKSIPESITLYLAAVRKRCPTNEIIQGLKKGGIVSTSKTFDIVVGNTLRRLKSEGKLLLFDDGWGLPEWVPEGLRSRVDQQVKAQTKSKKKKPSKAKDKKELSSKPSVVVPINKGLEQRIEAVLKANGGKSLSPAEVAKTLEVGVKGVALALGRMAAKDKAEKCGDSTYRATRDKVQKTG